MHCAVSKCVAAAALLMVVFGGASAAQGAKFIGLGDLSGGVTYSTASAVSANGSVVVGSGYSASGNEAFRWTSATGPVGLGDLPGGVFISEAYGVSGDGSVVVGRGHGASGYEAFRWTSGSGMVGLGEFPGGVNESSAVNVSGDGAVTMGYSYSAAGIEAFRWTSGSGMVSLGELPGGAYYGYAYDSSADGAVIVGTSNSAPGYEAFRWTSSGGMVGLGDLPGGGTYSVGRSVSADGSVVVGGSESGMGPLEAFRWTSGDGMVPLGDLPGGAVYGLANSVSADGSVVVGYSETGLGLEAFVWDATNGMRRVRDVLSPSVGAALNGWTLSDVTAISADGRTVVGNGINPNGSSEAWLAYLADSVYWFPNTSGNWDSSLSWSGPFMPGAADEVIIDPTSAATINGPATHQTINSLYIGGSGVGRVTLRLSGETNGDLNVATYAVLYPNGELALADGRSFSAGFATYNSGVIRGTGTVHSGLWNYADGQVRVAAGELLVISGGGHTNEGKFEAIGGSLEFFGNVTNSADTGLVTGRNATLRFRDGLTNDGAMLLTSGVNDVMGDIDNTTSGTIVVSGGAAATFYDDVIQNGVLRVSKVGSTTSSAVFAGAFTGSGGSTGGGDIFFEGDLRPGNSPAVVNFANNIAFGSGAELQIEIGGIAPGSGHDQVNVTGQLSLDGTLLVSLIDAFNPLVGQSFDILNFTPGSLSGTFSSITLPTLTAGKAWDTTQLYTTGVLSVSAALIAGDFDADGDVDGADFIAWQTNFPTPTGATLADGDADGDADVDGADFAAWQTSFPHAPGPGTSPVPEPASGILAALVGLALVATKKLHRRRVAFA